ncbi:MAG: DUF1343 domain-containing protein [Tunicatimonas sp.]
MNKTILLIALLGMAIACQSQTATQEATPPETVADQPIRPGAYQTNAYLPLLAGKAVALVVNHTSLINQTHLVDSLVALGVNVKQIFAPEHGFRGEAGAGDVINDSTDPTTGLPIVSLYGKNKKPTPEQLAAIDLVIFDIQDVGARFYTYISTMHYVMEACAEQDKAMLVLDRPNPNGFYVGGPVLQPGVESFVGMHPIPVVHGLTVGELAGMINGEGWLTDSAQTDLTVIPVANYSHRDRYSLPVRPSPNLPNDQAVNLYAALCLLEGTVVTLGRGTDFPFQVYGHPSRAFAEVNSAADTFSFVPRAIPGVVSSPKHENQRCYGADLRQVEPLDQFTLKYVLLAHEQARAGGISDKDFFLTATFRILAGNETLQQQIAAGQTEAQIKQSWEADLAPYRAMREQYLLYEDFE